MLFDLGLALDVLALDADYEIMFALCCTAKHFRIPFIQKLALNSHELTSSSVE